MLNLHLCTLACESWQCFSVFFFLGCCSCRVNFVLFFSSNNSTAEIIIVVLYNACGFASNMYILFMFGLSGERKRRGEWKGRKNEKSEKKNRKRKKKERNGEKGILPQLFQMVTYLQPL